MSYQKMYMNQIYSSSIMRQVALMWKNQLLCDAVIKTGNVQTKAHRLVLIAACPMLQDTDNASVGSHLEVRLNSDITETAVTTFLQYLYEGYMMLTEDNCRDVEKIAKLLHMDSITKCCTDFQKCMNIKMGYTSSQGLNFDLQDSIDFRFVNTTDLLKMVPENQLKRLNKEMNPVSPAYKRPRYQQSGHFSNHSSQRPDDHLSMNDSYNISSERIQARSQSQDEGVIDISENSVELVNIGPGARDTDGWPINTDLPPIRTSSSVSVTNQKETASDVQIVDVQPARIDRSQPQQCNIATYGRIQDSRSNSFIAGTSQAIPVAVQSHSPSSARGTEESPQYISMSSNTVRENTPALSPLSSGSPNSNRKHRGADEMSRPFALGSAPTEHRSFSMLPASSIKAVDLVQNAHIYPETQKSIKDITYRNSNDEVKEKSRTSASPEPIVVKLEEEDTESGKIEVYIQDPQNDSYSHDPGDPGGEGLVELDTDLSNDDSITMEPGPSWQPQEGQDPACRSTMKIAKDSRNEDITTMVLNALATYRRNQNDGMEILTTQINDLTKDMVQVCESSASIQYMVEELIESSSTVEKLLINMTPGLNDEEEDMAANEMSSERGEESDSVSLEREPGDFRKMTSNYESFFAEACESSKEQASGKYKDNFSDIPQVYQISQAAMKELKASSRNAGVFAGNIIKKLFPELFGPSNLRFRYSFFGGGKLKKCELDRQRKSYMRRYVTAAYPEISSESDWKSIVSRVNEILRRPSLSIRKPKDDSENAGPQQIS